MALFSNKDQYSASGFKSRAVDKDLKRIVQLEKATQEVGSNIYNLGFGLNLPDWCLDYHLHLFRWRGQCHTCRSRSHWWLHGDEYWRQ